MMNQELHNFLLSLFRHSVEKQDDCWIWHGAVVHNGLPVISFGKGKFSVRRIIYQILCGPIPEHGTITCTCLTPLCIAPAHLALGRWNAIEDSFSGLPISRERKRQLRKQLAGLCITPRCNQILIGARHCKKHLIEARERQRKRNGCIERYDSMSYHL